MFTGTQTARPGEQVQIDCTPIDVLVLLDNGVPVRADLTIAVDVATRTICAAVLRPVGTKAVDATGTHNLVYANADVSESRQSREVIAFCNHWKAASGTDPHMLIMDQKVTTHTVLGDDRGIRFLTLRMRSAALMNHIDALTAKDFTTVTLNRSGKFNRPKVSETTGVRLTGYPGTVRQLVVTGLGRDTPTVVATNNHDLTAKALIEHYARRMTIEQRLAEIIQAFHADALSSAVNPQRRPRHHALRARVMCPGVSRKRRCSTSGVTAA